MHDGLRLPSVDTEDRHTADTDYLNAAVLARWGVRCTVLQSLYHSAESDGRVERVHALELHEQRATTERLHAVTPAELSADSDLDALRRWRAALSRGVVDGREWTQRGWFRDVCAWLDTAMADCGAGRVRDVVQLRAWPSSAVLKVIADRRTGYCKALPASVAVEGRVTAYLSS